MSIILNNRSVIQSQDCYKFSHPFMISRDVTGLTSYIEARHSDFSELVFFGLQIYIREYLSKPITMEDVHKNERWAKSAGIPFNREMWEHVVNYHDGFLPVEISALPEGTPVKPGVPMVQITSKDAKYPGLISVVETSLLRAIWYPVSVASLSREIKKLMKHWLDKTSTVGDMALPVMLNDFGARGVSSGESSVIGGMAHLVNFIGSDTFEAIGGAEMFYDHNVDRDGPVLVSVPATEHSVTTINGKNGEAEFVGRVLNTFDDNRFPIVSIVADSYDLDNFVSNIIGTIHKEEIQKRNGWVVVRPDSGIPWDIVPEVLEKLWEKFGGTVNEKGFKVLDPHVRVIQGDGVNYESINMIFSAMADRGFSAENVVFGMGGALLQKVTRDDHSFAMKTNAVMQRGGNEWLDVQKTPKTDMSKASKAGRQAVVRGNDGLMAIREDDLFAIKGGHGVQNWLQPVWDCGKVIRTQTFNEVRENAKI